MAADDFYDPVHRDVYDAIVRLHQDRKAIDIVTVSDALKTNDRHDLFAGPAFLATLASEVPTASHAGYYADIVKDRALKRRIEKLGHTLAELGRDDTQTAADLVEIAEQKVLALSHQSVATKPQYLTDLTDASSSGTHSCSRRRTTLPYSASRPDSRSWMISWRDSSQAISW